MEPVFESTQLIIYSYPKGLKAPLRGVPSGSAGRSRYPHLNQFNKLACGLNRRFLSAVDYDLGDTP
ncbi:hypothetical protein D3C71_2205070 [compost metagenome]